MKEFISLSMKNGMVRNTVIIHKNEKNMKSFVDRKDLDICLYLKDTLNKFNYKNIINNVKFILINNINKNDITVIKRNFPEKLLIEEINSFKKYDHYNNNIDVLDGLLINRIELIKDSKRYFELPILEHRICKLCVEKEKKVFFYGGFLETFEDDESINRSELIDIYTCLKMKVDFMILDYGIQKNIIATIMNIINCSEI